jgi:alpha-beta hydrolase superfamily lysophospholipase
MTTFQRRAVLASLVLVVLIACGVAARQLPSAGAGALLHPSRRRVTAAPPPTCQDATFAGEGLELKGWRCRASRERRGTLVYLHGVADNRTSASGVIDRFGKRGFDVVAYDSRAHGESAGDICTYGFMEKRDLHHVLDTVGPGPIVLLGTSLGAAVALQEAALDARVTAVIAAEPFSDLRTIATERAPFFFSSGTIARAFQIAERQGRFDVDAVSPVAASADLAIPVLLVHGSADSDTPAEHSRRILAALAGPKRLILVPGARHNESLRGEVWDEIERWLDDVLVIQTSPADTSVTFGKVTRDLTGDAIPETLTLTGTGRTIGDLAVTFTIRAPGRILYEQAWRLTRADFDSRRRISDAELQARLADYGRSFFADSQFMSPTRFLPWLQASLPLHVPQIPDVIASDMTPQDSARAQSVWEQMQAAPITLFSFSPGGDRVMVIGWSAADQRFYNLLDCC